MAGYTFVLTDLDGVPIGEPRATARSGSFGVSKPATAGWRLRTDDDLWDDVADGETMLKIYAPAPYNYLVIYYGPIITDEESAQGQGSSVQITSADLSWRLGKRLVGKDPAGVGAVYTSTTTSTIAHALLALANADGATGITQGYAAGTFVSTSTKYLWKPVLDAIMELGGLAGSYEWFLSYPDDNRPPTVELNFDEEMGFDNSPNVHFEYGTGKSNCKAYSRIRDRGRLATHVWALGAGTQLTAAASDAAAATALRSRYEDMVAYPDLSVTSLLDALALAHVAIRKQPRIVVSVTPNLDGPQYPSDYGLGDYVTVRIVTQGSIRVDGLARVWGVDWTQDETGNLLCSPRLVPV
jgi:hypothetical protein